MAKLIYQKFDGTDAITEVEYPTLEKALYEAHFIHTTVTGQPIKIIDGDKIYGHDTLINLWRSIK
jgi:hypothetical protein